MSDKYRLLIYESGVGKGGARRSLLTWIDLLQEIPEIKPVIYCGMEGWFTQELSKKNIPYSILPEPEGLTSIRHVILKQPSKITLLGLQAIPGLMQAWGHLLSVRVDGIILTHPRDLIMLFPLVITNQKHTAVIPQSTDWSDIPLTKTTCQLSSRVWAISKTVADSIINLGIKPSKTEVLPFIFVEDNNPKRREKLEILQELELPQDAKLLGVIGSIRQHKGQLEAIEIFAKIQKEIEKAYLLVVGAPFFLASEEQEYYQKLQDRVTELNLQDSVKFLGWREDTYDIMAALDIFLMPSHHSEGVPRVILESLEAATPIIATDIPPIREIIQPHQVGYLAALDNLNIWAEFAISILKDADKQSKLSHQARLAWKENYSAEVAKPILKKVFLQNLAS